MAFVFFSSDANSKERIEVRTGLQHQWETSSEGQARMEPVGKVGAGVGAAYRDLAEHIAAA